MLAKKGLMTAPAAVAQYVEDVFSTYIYTGTSSAQTITNNIDLSGEGGLVWNKLRAGAGLSANNKLYDTVRGVNKELSSNLTSGEGTKTDALNSFNTTGFTLGAQDINETGGTYVSWTFRKAEKFFDVVTYTGTGVNGRTVAHNLGSVPGVIIVKQVSASGEPWRVYHRSLGASARLELNTTDAATTGNDEPWYNTSPTSTHFTVAYNSANKSGETYVAYLFAHDAGGFGDAGDQSVIKCGSFTGTDGTFVDLGWEPQWVLIKASSTSGSWLLMDNMRGLVTGGDDQYLIPNTSDAEGPSQLLDLNPTGFTVKFSAAGATYVYIAIRRGPMKTPESATSVFDVDTYTGNNGVSRLITTGFVTDMSIIRDRNSATEAYRYNYLQDRLRAGGNSLATSANSFEASDTGWDNTDMRDQFRSNTGILVTVKSSRYNANSASYVTYNFARAPGFFDIVAYTGTGANTTITHNLGVAPELIITKRRLSSANWATYSSETGNTKYLVLNETDAAATDTTFWNSTSPTSTTFSLGSAAMPNQSTQAYIAYLFASLPGISKIGSYTGNGSTTGPTITTGFSPRFLMIKCTSTNGPWVVYDTARGLQGSDEAVILINSLDAEYSGDYVDPSSTGFQLVSAASDINSNGATYLYLAIA